MYTYAQQPQMDNYYGGVNQTPPQFSSQPSNIYSIGGQGYNQGYNNQYYYNNMTNQYNNGYYNNNQYNGGYYNNNNYTVYNPYLVEEQKKKYEAQRAEEIKQNCDMMKVISRKVNKALGNEISEEELKELYEPKDPAKPTKEELEIQNTYRLMAIDYYNTVNNITYRHPLSAAMARQQEINQQELDPNMDLYDFFKASGRLISNMMKREVMRNYNAGALYNRADYQRLLDARSANNFGGTLEPKANIDDMEIKLPDYLKTKYFERKQKFIKTIIERGKGIKNG